MNSLSNCNYLQRNQGFASKTVFTAIAKALPSTALPSLTLKVASFGRNRFGMPIYLPFIAVQLWTSLPFPIRSGIG